MKKRYKIFICFLIIILLFLGFDRYKTYTFTFDERKQGEPLMMPVESPNHKYSAISYGIPYGGAAGGVDVKVEIIYKKTNTKKTIYYADYKQDFELQWLDNETLFIKNEDREYNDIKVLS